MSMSFGWFKHFAFLIYRVLIDSFLFTVYSIADVAAFSTEKKNNNIRYPFGRRTFIITDRTAADHILRSMNYSARFAFDYGLKILGMYKKGLIWNNDHRCWKKNRAAFQKGLSSTNMKNVVAFAKENVKLVFPHVRKSDDKINMLNALRWITLNFTMAQLLGLPFEKDLDSANDLIESIVEYFKGKKETICSKIVDC